MISQLTITYQLLINKQYSNILFGKLFVNYVNKKINPMPCIHTTSICMHHTWISCYSIAHISVWYIPYQFQLPGHGHPLSTMKVLNYWYLIIYMCCL